MDHALHRGETYVDSPPHDLFTRLRREEPVVWQEMDGEPGYWAVLRHADVVHVAKNSDVFSATEGGVVIENLEPAGLEQMRDMLLAMDPPRHTAYRRPLAPEFKARVIAEMEGRIRTITREILDRTDALGSDIEFVHDVCAHLPSQVIGELMGLPREDWAAIHAMAEQNSGGQDPDIADEAERGGSSVDMAMYGIAFAGKRREMPVQGDLTDLLLGDEFDGKQMTDIDFGRFFVQLVTAGNDTTRTMLSGGLHALLEHPEQMQMLREDSSLIPSAVEEILRWANPLHYFRRTAMADVELGGAAIKTGDKVAMIYTSANRDEDVFEDSQQFDITRDPNHHLSFGIATHFCLGVHLARLEGRIFFEEVLARWPSIELNGVPKRQQSNLNNSLKKLPVRVG
ncbi:MAG: cytochrome P450 [Acidimicrobiales bacterium]|jgi:cytochrome P450|nr:cytochrome P450 [Acidimicrobiales bacterium]